MPDYRVYPVDKNDHILGPQNVVTCDSDQEAIEKALPLVNGHDVELWQGARQLVRIRTKQPEK